jgi:hypothetical protein
MPCSLVSSDVVVLGQLPQFGAALMSKGVWLGLAESGGTPVGRRRGCLRCRSLSGGRRDLREPRGEIPPGHPTLVPGLLQQALSSCSTDRPSARRATKPGCRGLSKAQIG